ncbi:MAG: NAD(P)H-quinone oxidoreductase [Devosiaceae bacterium]|nr:NAD(P)H-quinone oxidoreductase [Devosiaceae bacterium]
MRFPKQIKAIYISDFGAPETLQFKSRTLNAPKPNEITIKVKACGINGPDILQRNGFYQPTKQNAKWLGLEVAGEIAFVGEKAGNWKIGDKIVALCNGGAYANYVNVPFGQVLPLPKDWSFIEGATLPETFFTIYQTLIMKAKLKKNMFVLVHGASGGIGASAIQIAKLFGATIICCVSSKVKADYVRTLGADYIINYREQDFVEEVLKITNGKGVDRIIDVVGGTYLKRNIKTAAHGATIIQLAFLGGAKAEINIAPILLKNLTIFGSTLGPKNSQIKAKIAQGLKNKIWPALNERKIKAQHIRTFKLEEATKAHHAFEAKEHYGKIVLVVD